FSRRTSWLKLAFWLIFTGIFNLAGLLTYLAFNHTKTIKCPVCNRYRGLVKVNCVRCGSEMPLPEEKKTDLIYSS
ncbi:MAG: hypothetical protein ACYSSI_10185, partial [Planctomycetota bacterium]